MVAKIDRVGETRVMNCGMKATIIRYGGYNDIDVRFEDGAVAEHKTYGAFKKSGIANSNIKASAKKTSWRNLDDELRYGSYYYSIREVFRH